MGFLGRLFGGRKPPSTPQNGVPVYVRIKRTGEVVPVWLRRGYDISIGDDGELFANKLVMGRRSMDKVEATFYFDKTYRFLRADLSGGGEMATADDYQAQQNSAS